MWYAQSSGMLAEWAAMTAQSVYLNVSEKLLTQGGGRPMTSRGRGGGLRLSHVHCT